MKTSAQLTVRCASPKTAHQLRSVLEADNRVLPTGLSFKATSSMENLSFVFKADRPSTVLSTSVALLRDISLFEQVWLLSSALAPQLTGA